MNANFKIGDIVFSEYGQEAEVIALGNSTVIVRPVYVGHEEPSWGAVEEWRKAYAVAPVAKFSAKIVELEAEISAKRTEISGLSLEKHLLEADAKERMARLKQHRALETLDLFLQNKITHYFVECAYQSPKIITLEQSVSDESTYNKPLRLLSLYGGSKGDLTWKLSHYSDGSGGKEDVFPCISYEDALERLKVHVAGQFDEYRKNPPSIHLAIRAVKGCAEYGIPVPDDVREAIRLHSIMIAEQELAKANTAAFAAHKKFTEAQSA